MEKVVVDRNWNALLHSRFGPPLEGENFYSFCVCAIRWRWNAEMAPHCAKGAPTIMPVMSTTAFLSPNAVSRKICLALMQWNYKEQFL